ncbi:MAG: hypothetical protein ACREPM_05715 [Gemmatimonadaceae bacterium]
MSDAPLPGQGPYERGAFRYGMLLLIVALWCVAWRIWLTRTPQDRSGPAMNLVVTSMLLVNHVITSFLSVEHRRRVRLVQVIVVGAGVWYVLRTVYN